MSTPSGPPNDQSGPPQPGQPQQPGQQPPQPYGSPPGNPPPGFDPYGTQQPQQYSPYYRQMGGYFSKASNASTILILGIVGLVVCAPCGIAAWIMGRQTLKDMEQG